MNSRVFFCSTFIFVSMGFFPFGFANAQANDGSIKSEISEVEKNELDGAEISPEEKIRRVEETDEIPTDVKKIIIEQIKNPQKAVDESKLPQVKCNDYYKFQSVQVSLGSNLDTYVPGDAVVLSGEIINQNSYPVVDGNVFARVSRKNQNYIEEGNYIVDEFFIKENVSLKEGEVQALSFKWNIPENITGGNYRIDYFFSVGKKFNLGGLPFSNEVVIGATEFSIDSSQKSFISFDRSKTVVNGEKYRHIGNWPIFGSEEKVVINQPLLNSFDQEKKIKVTYSLYHWDSLNKNDLKDSKTEEIVIPAKSSKDLEYVIPQMDDAVYYLQIVAESGVEKSIINIRVTSPQENIRLNYPAITKFPINQSDDFTLFSCFHNGSSISSEGRVEIILADEKGVEVGKFQYQGAITSSMLAEKAELNAKKDYEFLKLSAKTYDKNNNLTDEYEAIYDCKEFNSCKEKSTVGSIGLSSLNGSVKSLVMIFLVIVFIVFGFVIGKVITNKKK